MGTHREFASKAVPILALNGKKGQLNQAGTAVSITMTMTTKIQ